MTLQNLSAQPGRGLCWCGCGGAVSRDTALAHLANRHGCMFRVEGWMKVLGMPEESFDELLAFVLRLKSKPTPEPTP